VLCTRLMLPCISACVHHHPEMCIRIRKKERCPPVTPNFDLQCSSLNLAWVVSGWISVPNTLRQLVQTTHRHPWLISVPGPLKWSVDVSVCSSLSCCVLKWLNGSNCFLEWCRSVLLRGTVSVLWNNNTEHFVAPLQLLSFLMISMSHSRI